MNTVDSIEGIVADVTNGRWDKVLQQISTLSLPTPLLIDLYGQMVIELIEMKEVDTARSILLQSEAMLSLKQTDPERYLQLQRLLGKQHLTQRDAYPDGSTKDKRRAAIAKGIATEVKVVEPSRLNVLLEQAVKWQQLQGLLPAGTELDLFRGAAVEQVEEDEAIPKECFKTITMGKKSHPESTCFSPDGRYFLTGSVDGLIEVWDWATGKLSPDLSYQAEDKFMVHDSGIFCMQFTRDSEMMVSGSQDGKIKVWRLSTGKCLRRFERAHAEAVTSVCFADDNSHVLSASYDNTIRVHGLKSGNTLKVFRGHKSYVNKAIYADAGRRIISASSDGTVRVWDTKSTDCIQTFSPTSGAAVAEVAIHSLQLHPQNEELLLVGNKSAQVHVMNFEGKVLRTFSLDGVAKTTSISTSTSSSGPVATNAHVRALESPLIFTQTICSRRGAFVYAVADDGQLYIFNSGTGRLEHTLQLSQNKEEVIGVSLHSQRNIFASYAADGSVRIYKQ
eukprot:TRINITY_DN3704_c0_g1_i1.p1 TRINITY_DN3704_c0_g1~~TRINITY_DN3704_c0_g1_i1.p1  ORF type:complete len:564 (+),score=78.93 TRINITY_DN3704_c0_g1_i1:180-1694(+)